MITVALPARFIDDHYGRCDPVGISTEVKRSERYVTLELDDAEINELHSDAEHYAGTAMSEWTEGSAVRRSAVATVRRLVAAQSQKAVPGASQTAPATAGASAGGAGAIHLTAAQERLLRWAVEHVPPDQYRFPAGDKYLVAHGVAKFMWPDSPGWHRVQNVGGGATSGVAIVRKGGQFANKLVQLGVFRASGDYGHHYAPSYRGYRWVEDHPLS